MPEPAPIVSAREGDRSPRSGWCCDEAAPEKRLTDHRRCRALDKAREKASAAAPASMARPAGAQLLPGAELEGLVAVDVGAPASKVAERARGRGRARTRRSRGVGRERARTRGGRRPARSGPSVDLRAARGTSSVPEPALHVPEHLIVGPGLMPCSAHGTIEPAHVVRGDRRSVAPNHLVPGDTRTYKRSRAERS